MTQTSNKSQDISVANLKGILLLCVFVYHSISALKYVTTPQWLPIEHQVIFTRCLSRVLGTFFLISGYYSIREDFNLSIQYWVKHITKKFKALLIPYFLWNFIYIMTFCVGAYFLPVIAKRVHEMELTTFWGIIGAELGIWTRPADGPLWYLRDVFYLSLCSPFLAVLAQWKKGVALLVLFPVFFLLPLYGVFCPVNSYEVIAFSLGIWMRQQKVSLHFFETKSWVAVTSLIIFVIGMVHRLPMPYMQLFFDAGGEYLVLIPICLYIMKYLNYDFESWGYQWITKPSFFVFASHALCASFIVRILCPLLPITPINGILFALIYCIGGGTIVYMAYCLLIKKTKKLSTYLIGGR